MFNIIKTTDHRSTRLGLAALALSTAGLAFGQTPATLGTTASQGPGTDPEWSALPADELEALVGPIALYPDDLIAIILPASTFPLQIVQASRYLEQRESDSALQPDDSWDDSIVALLNYPQALALLNDDLDWTYDLGEAVVYQQGDLLNAIQSFRDRAYASGNLATDERQVVATEDGGAITITPADPEVIYVPYYDPARVVVRGYTPAYGYYPYAYPVYYYPYPVDYSFGSGLFWGVTTAFLIGWHDHYLHVYDRSYYGHPYYGYHYYTPRYTRTNLYVNVNIGDHYRWRPSYRHGARPRVRAGYAPTYRTANIRASAERRIRGNVNGERRSYDTGDRSGRRATSPSANGRRVTTSGQANRRDAGQRNSNAGQRFARAQTRGASAQLQRRANDRAARTRGARTGSSFGRIAAPRTVPDKLRSYARREQPVRAPSERGSQRATSRGFGSVSPSRSAGRAAPSTPRSAPPAASRGAPQLGHRRAAPAVRNSGGTARGGARQRGSRFGGVAHGKRDR